MPLGCSFFLPLMGRIDPTSQATVMAGPHLLAGPVQWNGAAGQGTRGRSRGKEGLH